MLRGRPTRNPDEQRVWKRVESSDAPQGHLLEADLGGFVWQAWQLDDGQWQLIGGGFQSPMLFPEWQDVRLFVEKGLFHNPARRNPVDPITATAAAAGMGIAMRHALMSNPTRPVTRGSGPTDWAYDVGFRDAAASNSDRSAMLSGAARSRYARGYREGRRR